MKLPLLKKRIQEAPRMEPTDAVKLAYQSAFGCGHLLSPDGECLRFLEEELAQTPPDPDCPAATLIGGGLCRLHLAAPAVRALSPARLLSLMELTQTRVSAREGLWDGFRADLQALRELIGAGETPFTPAALESYLAAYEAQGCPPVSHSPAYREAYRPAYRVVLSDFIPLLPLLCQMDSRMAQGSAAPLTVVLDGSCGAGKTTLAALLRELYGAPVLHMDDFFLPFELRTPQRLAQQGGNIHYERFEAQVLPFLPSQAAFPYQRFDCATGAFLPRLCPGGGLRVVEGSYSLHPRFRQAYQGMDALTAFVAVSAPEQRKRLLLRDPSRFPRFESEWIPLEKSYFEAYDIQRGAKLVLQSLPWEGEP